MKEEEIEINEIKFGCIVLDNGSRILSDKGMDQLLNYMIANKVTVRSIIVLINKIRNYNTEIDDIKQIDKENLSDFNKNLMIALNYNPKST